MPNWVKNKVRTVNKADTQKLLAMLVHKDKYGVNVTNFNGIIPMPKDLQDTEVSSTEESRRKQAENKARYGFESWWDFGVKVWGTKWDWNKVDIEDGVIVFETAWSMPSGIYREIAKTIPIIVAYADEDIGSNFGVVRFDADGTSIIKVDGTDKQIANAIWNFQYEEGECGEKEDYSSDVEDAINNILTK